MHELDDTSPLASILAKAKAKKEAKHLDLRVDGLSDAVGYDVFVRYAKKVPFERLKGYGEKRRKTGRGSWELLSNLDLMVDSCVGVYAVLDGKEYGMSPDAPTDPEEWPKFDDQLRAALPDGVGESAVKIAHALFDAGYSDDEAGAADPEILSHGNRLTRFYGYNKDDDLGG